MNIVYEKRIKLKFRDLGNLGLAIFTNFAGLANLTNLANFRDPCYHTSRYPSLSFTTSHYRSLSFAVPH